MTPSRIGRFEVRRPLGSGSFATVWLARDEELDGFVAIKLLAENWSFHQDARRRFLEEARSLRRLDSDRIVRVYDVGSLGDGRPYMVMEYADRGSLEDRVRLRAQLGSGFTVREAVGLAVEVAECLIAAHGQRIVHRDVKPSNILFRSVSRDRLEGSPGHDRPVNEERTLLGDFGIARRLEGPLGHTMVVGSPQYMAPEQADPERAGLVDYRSDLYSAAVIVYELLAGELPFSTHSLSALGRVDGDARPPALERLRPEVPVALTATIAKGLSRHPEGRFSSAREWRDALEASLRGGTIIAASTQPQGTEMGSAAGRRAAVPSRPIPGAPSRVPTSALPTRRDTAVLPGSQPRHRPTPPPVAGSRPSPSPAGPPPAVRSAPPIGHAASAPSQTGAANAPPAPVGDSLGVRAFGAGAALAAVSVATGVLLPWAKVASSPHPGDRLGIAFRGGEVALACAAALLLCAVRLWRGRRRWAVTPFAALAVMAGVAAAGVAGYELLAQGSVGAALDLPAHPAREGVSAGVGLHVVLGGGLLGLAAGWAGFRRLRRDRRAERVAAAVQAATASRR